MAVPMALLVTFLVAMATSDASASAVPKNMLVVGGLMKSHQLAMVPVIEGLLERGHNVTFILPNSHEARGWFTSGIGRTRLLHLGPEDSTFESFKIPDFKNMRVHQKIAHWADLLWNYRRLLDKPFFGMTEDFEALLREEPGGFDAAFSFGMALGCNQLLAKGSIPWIGFMSIPPYPEFLIQDTDLRCNYPNMANPRSLIQLKSSLAARVQNRIECKLLEAYSLFATWTVNGILRDRGFRKVPHFSQLLLQAPLNIMLGGPPMSLPVPLPSKVQLVGTVELPKPRDLPPQLAAWLSDAATAGATVVYVSMGTKYELTTETGGKLLQMLSQLQSSLGLRVLWSLRSQQQDLLREQLPTQSSSIRIEAFTPQPEVLKHSAVKIFLSHCGWGGVTDSLAAGVPILAYPSFSDQKGNAQRLSDAGAALMVHPDFGNLPEVTARILKEPSFASASQLLGQALRKLGGLNRTVQLLEAAASGRYLEPLPEMSAANQVDPFLHRTHELEIVLSTAFACGCFLLGLCIFTCCCRGCLWCCCPWLSKPVKVKKSKKNQ